VRCRRLQDLLVQITQWHYLPNLSFKLSLSRGEPVDLYLPILCAGLSIRVQLLRVLPPRLKVTVLVTPGTHASEAAVNKQLNDKERVAAALENNNIMEVINQCIADNLIPAA